MTDPLNQQKLEAVELLARLAEDAGVTLPELAVSFVINHPAVTSAIIGPRTADQLKCQLPEAACVLTSDVLDEIDRIVAPGVTVTSADHSYGTAELAQTARRRRG